jgi:alpha-amylase
MTHPGTPCIYYDHFFELQYELQKLSEIRSLITDTNVTILEACNNLYKAKIGNIIIQIGRYSKDNNSKILFQSNIVLISLIKMGTTP